MGTPGAISRNLRSKLTALACVVGVVGMLAMAYASESLYQLFCQVTGYGGTTQVAKEAPDTVMDRVITVRFDAMVASNLAWVVEPLTRKLDLRLGETRTVFYRATNITDQPVTGTSRYSVAAAEAGSYFNKIDCFCFTKQTLGPGESKDMGVTFFISPDLDKDKDFHSINTIMLTYAFYEANQDEAPTREAYEQAIPHRNDRTGRTALRFIRVAQQGITQHWEETWRKHM